MIISPLDNDDVIASFSHYVTNGVLVAPLVFDKDFLTRSLGSVNSDEKNIST